MDAEHVVRCPGQPTAVTLIHVDQDGRKQTMSRPGANQSLAPADIHAAAATIRGARLLLVQLEVPLSCVHEAMRIAQEAGVRIVLDPAPVRPLPDELLRHVAVIRLNAGEAEVLSGVAVHDRDTAGDAAERLLGRGVGAVVVQASDAGNLLVKPDGERWLPQHEVDTVDTTGAGDAFSAAIAVRLADGSPLEEACGFASAVAALTTTALGAQAALPTHAAASELLDRSTGARLPSRPTREGVEG